MHIPDGFFTAGASAGAGLVAGGAIAIAVKKTRDVLDDKAVPLGGLLAAFIFAAQMVNFPVAAGTSGHLIGGALAAILVGPWFALVAMSVVVIVQVLFADGGVTAVGLNLVILGAVTVGTGSLSFRLAKRMLPATRGGITLASGIAAFVSVLAAATAFSFAFTIGGSASIDPPVLFRAMLGVHLLIAVAEGVITAGVVSLVVSVRPDLVAGAHELVPSLVSEPVVVTR